MILNKILLNNTNISTITPSFFIESIDLVSNTIKIKKINSTTLQPSINNYSIIIQQDII